MLRHGLPGHDAANVSWEPSARSPRRTGYSNGTMSRATMLMILISGLIAGPAVSL